MRRNPNTRTPALKSLREDSLVGRSDRTFLPIPLASGWLGGAMPLVNSPTRTVPIPAGGIPPDDSPFFAKC